MTHEILDESADMSTEQWARLSALGHEAIYEQALTRWTTLDEEAFIVGLGCHAGDPDPAPSARLVLLQRYRDALYLRSDWAGLDRAAILRAADAQVWRVATLVDAALAAES